jgi:uncharacterized membrane protein YfhO
VLYSALDGSAGVIKYFTRIEPKDSDRTNISTARVNDEYHTTKYAVTDTARGDAHVDYLVEMDKDSDLYMFLPTKYERNCNIWVQDEESYINGDKNKMDFAGCFFVGDNYSILNLGHFIEGEEVRVRVTIDNDDNEAYWCDTLFYTLDKEAFKASAERISANTAAITEFGNRNVTFECEAADDDSCLFTTIPDEPGWVITVNGEEAAYDKCAETLITVPLRKGKNTVKMVFDPDYYRIGKAMTAAGLLIILVIFIFEYKDGRIVKKMITSSFKKVEDVPAESASAENAASAEETPAEETAEVTAGETEVYEEQEEQPEDTGEE